jgi:hypothetical protein
MPQALPSIESTGHTLLDQEFKKSLQQLGNAVVSIVQLLSQPAKQVNSFALGTRLALLLTLVRKHRSHVLAISSHVEDPEDLMKYLQGLGQLRASVAQWLTIHAAEPNLIYVEIADFGKQCWSTLALGMVLLDSVRSEDLSINSALATSFHQWWADTNNRAVGFSI